MGSISFVILNYKTWREAAACAESIFETQAYGDIAVVIVDNGSGNGSVEKLRERFAGESRIHIVASDKNVGFARGNNLGIRYAREHFDPDYVVAANSDIIFDQRGYCEKIGEIHARHRFDILGGDIVDAAGVAHFNPVAQGRNYTKKYLFKKWVLSHIKGVAYRLLGVAQTVQDACHRDGGHRDGTVAAASDALPQPNRTAAALKRQRSNMGDKSRIKGVKKSTSATREVNGASVSADTLVGEELEDVLLHGCCLIFSREFFFELDGFYEGTFLYAEEEILYYLAMQRGMTTLYSPKIRCTHKEAVTTDEMTGGGAAAKVFYYTQIARSYRKMLGLMLRERDVTQAKISGMQGR